MSLKNPNRRDFLKTLGFAVISVQVLPGVLQQACAQDVSLATPQNSITVHSGPSKFAPFSGHFHDVLLPTALLSAPPIVGVSLITSTAFLHHHRINLSQAMLISIAEGNKVDVEDTVGDHHYVLSLHPPQVAGDEGVDENGNPVNS